MSIPDLGITAKGWAAVMGIVGGACIGVGLESGWLGSGIALLFVGWIWNRPLFEGRGDENSNP